MFFLKSVKKMYMGEFFFNNTKKGLFKKLFEAIYFDSIID